MNTGRNTLLIFIVSVLLSACVAPTTIASNKAENYNKEPKRIFVLTDVGSEFGKDFSIPSKQSWVLLQEIAVPL